MKLVWAYLYQQRALSVILLIKSCNKIQKGSPLKSIEETIPTFKTHYHDLEFPQYNFRTETTSQGRLATVNIGW